LFNPFDREVKMTDDKLLHWAIGLYTLGAFGSWVILSWLVEDNNKAAGVGATVALLGVVLFFLCLLDEGAGFIGGLVLCLFPASFPTGVIAQLNYDGSSHSVWFWTMLWMVVAGAVFVGLGWLARKANQKWGY
jgi:hypothetical protein